MVDVLVYEIDNEKYYVLDEIEINKTMYLYLSNVSDEADFMFRKRDKANNELLNPLDSEDEVKMVALVFANKLLSA